MSKDQHIDDTVEKLIELAHSYEKALECSNELISMKNRYIELCEMETAMYKKECIRLNKVLFWMSVCLGICTITSLSRLFI
jgi:hypothetical protein